MTLCLRHLWKKPKAWIACLLILSLIPIQSAVSSAAERAGTVALPVIMYHHLLRENKRLNNYTIHPDELEQDLLYLRDHGYTAVSAKELIDFCDGKASLPEKPVFITFDDGYESVYTYAYPLLKKYNAKAVVSIIGRYTDLYSSSDDHSVNYSHITWEQLREMSQSGIVEPSNHSYNLHSTTGAGKKAGESTEQYVKRLTEDLERLQNRFIEELGEAPKIFAYPFGKISPEALGVLKSLNFKVVLTCWEKVNQLGKDPEQLLHINRFNRPHGISTADFFARIEQGDD